jgi:hypothetical protein
VRGHGGIARASWAIALAIALGAAGCGSGPRQDANERAGTYKVDLVTQKFPTRQSLAKSTQLKLAVRNADTKVIPDLAVTVSSFSAPSNQAGLADPERPVWILDRPPAGRGTAYVDTWSLGHRLSPGKIATFTWNVTAVRSGTHVVKYKVAAGLDGKARAQLAGGQAPEGSFTVRISNKPADQRVNDADKIVPATAKDKGE